MYALRPSPTTVCMTSPRVLECQGWRSRCLHPCTAANEQLPPTVCGVAAAPRHTAAGDTDGLRDSEFANYTAEVGSSEQCGVAGRSCGCGLPHRGGTGGCGRPQRRGTARCQLLLPPVDTPARWPLPSQSCNAAGEDCRVSYATFDIKWESQIQVGAGYGGREGEWRVQR